jgi:hypothetical protein
MKSPLTHSCEFHDTKVNYMQVKFIGYVETNRKHTLLFISCTYKHTHTHIHTYIYTYVLSLSSSSFSIHLCKRLLLQ